MSSDDLNKTVFRQPGTAAPSGEHTIIRPMPGGRGGTGHTQYPPVAPAAAPTYGQQAAQPAAQPQNLEVQAAYFRT